MDWTWAWRNVYRYARRSGFSHEDAEDAAQTVCERIVRLGHDEVALNYLKRAVANLAADKNRYRGPLPLFVDYPRPDPRQDPETIVLCREEMRRAWAEATPGERDAIATKLTSRAIRIPMRTRVKIARLKRRLSEQPA